MSLSRLQLQDISQIVRAVARTEIMPLFRNVLAADIRQKTGPLDLVTVADERAEAGIAKALDCYFPGCLVVGEEAASADPGLLGKLRGADLAFVVDPVDGTSNFCAGLPLFGVIVAALRRGEVIAAVIHDPVGDDSALALRGEGAWLEAPGGGQVDMRVAAPAPAAGMAGAVSWRYMPEPLRSDVCRRLPRLGTAWDYRCAAHQYRMIAAGHCHYLVFQRLMPWDHAAGWLLHREAGGWSARFDGSEYDATETTGGLICAPDRESWSALHEALFKNPAVYGDAASRLAVSQCASISASVASDGVFPSSERSCSTALKRLTNLSLAR